MHLLQVTPGKGFRILLPQSRKKTIMCLTDVSSELSGAPDFCHSLAHGSCLQWFVGMGLGEGVSEIPATSFMDLVSPFLPLHLFSTWGVRGIL